MKSTVKIAELSDVHLGHAKTPTSHILRSLRHLFPDKPETWELDLIIIAGDLFDNYLEYSDDDVTDIELWWIAFCKMCAKHDIAIRTLEGTPLHDRKQMKRLFGLLEGIDVPVDAKYFSTLAIEKNEKLGLSFLYIPDEWRPRCDDTWVEVVDLLKQNGLDSVDVAVMHGAFPHQMPKNIHHQLELHDPERYLSIVKRVIYIGHVHQMSNYKDVILAAGSTDRLCHGDETPKGHWRSVLMGDGACTHTFIENKLALRYDTIDCQGMDSDSLFEKIDARVKKLPEGSHVRLVAKRSDVAMQAIDTLKMRHPAIHWTVKEPKEDGGIEKPVLLDARPKFQAINITADNIVELLMERVKAKHPGAIAERVEQRLKESLNG